MFDSTLHIPLKFYNSVEKQDRFKTYQTTRKFNLYTDQYHLPEFQVRVKKTTIGTTVWLVDASTDSVTDTITTLGDSLYFEEFTDYNLMIHNRTTDVTLPSTGEFYIKVTDGSDYLYSEVFSVVDIVGKNILTWYNTNDLGGIDYTNTGHDQYKHTLILDSVLAKPDYSIEEEAVEDGDGNVMITFQRHVKKFKTWFYAPEFIADAVSIIPLHDFVELTTSYGSAESETGSIYDFSVTTEWLETKGLAKITCEFRDQPIIKTTCGDNLV